MKTEKVHIPRELLDSLPGELDPPMDGALRRVRHDHTCVLTAAFH